MTRRRIDRRHRWKLAVLVAVPTLAALPWVVVTALAAPAVEPASAPASAFDHADAALILGARVYADGSPSPYLRDRVEIGVRLYRDDVVDRLIMSGDGEDSSGWGETAVMRALAESLGVPPTAISEDPYGLDTYSSCVRAHDELGAGSVVVATQQFHLARAVWLCGRAGMDAQGAYPPPTATSHTVLGHLREIPADAKAVLDIARGREPAG